MRSTAITVETTKAKEIINVTSEVMGIAEDALFISTPHTTEGLFLDEDDPELRRDYLKVAEKLLAPLNPFEHIRNNNPNTAAHVMGALFGTQIHIGISGGDIFSASIRIFSFWKWTVRRGVPSTFPPFHNRTYHQVCRMTRHLDDRPLSAPE